MVDNPSLYQEHVIKVASWQKYRKMKEQTYYDLLNGVLSKMNISNDYIDYPKYKEGDYGDYKEVRISIYGLVVVIFSVLLLHHQMK